MRKRFPKPRARGPKLIKARPVGGRPRIITGKTRRNRNRTKNRRRRPRQVRGKEVSIRGGAEPGQVVYGRVKVGGVETFVETSADTKAFLRTGEDNHQIVWICRDPGALGNNIEVRIVVSGTNPTLTVGLEGTVITVTARSTSGVSQSTANEVIAAVQAESWVNAIVAVHKGEGSGNGNVQPHGQSSLSGGGGTWLHHVITLACHEIDAVEKLYLDGREVKFGGYPDTRWAISSFEGRCFMAFMRGDDNQAVQPDLHAQLPLMWTAEHRQRGCALIYLILVYQATTFAQGHPDISMLLRGAKVWDPRISQTVWTRNPALIILNFLNNSKYGMSVPAYAIDEDNFIAAANICDELVDTIYGTQEPRYAFDGVFDTSMSPESVLEEMAECIAGDIVFHGGKWRVYLGAWREPVMTLSEEHLRGAVTITTNVGLRESFNAIRGTFLDAEHDYEEQSFPTVSSNQFYVQDGLRRRYEDIKLPFVTSPSTAQRIAKIRLFQARQGLMLEAEWSLHALRLVPTDTCYVNLAKYGFASKPFEVRDLALVRDSEGAYRVRTTMQETAPAIYDWNTSLESPRDIAPNTTLPSAFAAPDVIGLALSSGTDELLRKGDGTLISRIRVDFTIIHDATADSFDESGYFQVQYKKTTDTAWSEHSRVPGDFRHTHIPDVDDGEFYDVRVRGVNSLGAVGVWSFTVPHKVVGKTQPPSNLTGFIATVDEYGITLQWDEPDDIDHDIVEIRQGESWSAGIIVANTRSIRQRIEVRAAGTYTYWAKSRDTTGNYSVVAAMAVVTITAAEAPTISARFDGPNLILEWNKPASQNAIAYYELSYGDTFPGTPLGNIQGTVLTQKCSFGGARRFWIAARDIAGNLGAAGSVDVTVLNPNVVTGFVPEVIDNNILLKWTGAAVTTLPIDTYRIFRGPEFVGATLLGETRSTFQSYFEVIAGSYTYWVVSVDTAGNTSLPVARSVYVNQPPDFVLLTNQEIDAANGTLVNAIADEGDIILPVVNETWEEHFTNNGWSTIQDQINAGFPVFIEPGADYGYWEETYDLGALVSAGVIRFSFVIQIVSGSPEVRQILSYSADGNNWTEVEASAVFATNFRYVKLRFEVGTPPPPVPGQRYPLMWWAMI